MAKEVKEKKSLEEVMKDLDKQYGKGSVIHGGKIEKYDRVVSTGSLQLDIALGIGGIPVGRPGKIVEVLGWESSGKTTLIKNITGNFQKLEGKKVVYLDGENSFDEDYARALGIDPQDLFIVQLDAFAGEGAYNRMEKMVETGEVGLVVVDSVSAFKPKKIIEGEMGEASMGLHARMMSTLMDKVNSLCVEFGCTFVFINQFREKIGVMFGPSETTQGGNALKFYAHIRMETSRSTTNDNSTWEGKKGESERLGNLHKVKVLKNKMAPPFKKAEFYIRYGEGVEKYRELVDTAHAYKVVKVYGETTSYNGEKYKGEDFIQMLRDNDDLFQEIRNKVLIAAGIVKGEVVLETGNEETDETISV